MKTRTTKAVIIGAAFVAASIQVQALELPGANALSTGQYGDFYVLSLDLLKSCAPVDARCRPFKGDAPQFTEVDSSAGKIASKVIVYADASGAQLGNYDNGSGPFAGQNPAIVQVDNHFKPPTGVATSFDMTAAGEPDEPGQGPAASWTGDVAGRWDAKLSSIVSYLGDGNDLVFMFDNNQTGTDLGQAQSFWGRVDILDGAGGSVVDSFCLNNSFTFGVFDPASTACKDPFVEYTNPTTTGSFVSSGGRFCVDKTTGASFLPAGGPPSQKADCTAENGYFVANNLGASSAEFAAYVPRLNDNLRTWAAAGYFMQIDFKMRGLNDGGEKMWIDGIAVGQAPEPGSLALVAVALLGAAGVARRRRAR